MENCGTPPMCLSVSGQEINKTKKNKIEYRLIYDSLSKFVQVYLKSIELRETNENARMANLVIAINNFASASTSQDSLDIDPKVIFLDEKKGKGFPQSITTTKGG